MTLTFTTFLIVCPLVFLAGFVDAIGGGGGLISLPAFIFAGVPTHMAVATNKLSACCGTALSTGRFLKAGLINIKLAVPSIICAMGGSFIGAKLSLGADESLLGKVMVPVLFVSACLVLNKKIFKDGGSDVSNPDKRTYIVACIAAFVVGIYDGFYGPGTGTFLIIAFNVFAKINVKAANAQAKIINLATNVTSLAVFVTGGQVIWLLGFAGAVFNMAGNYLGSSLAVSKGGKITKPIIILVLALLFVKILSESF